MSSETELTLELYLQNLPNHENAISNGREHLLAHCDDAVHLSSPQGLVLNKQLLLWGDFFMKITKFFKALCFKINYSVAFENK